MEAVAAVDGPVLVIAGAGSGKTRVIEYRVLHLVEQGAPPDSILLLTFTRRAAGEMLRRAAGHNPDCMRVEGGTFHSFAYKMLKRYSKGIDYPADFKILDEGDASEAVSRCCTRLGYSGKIDNFPRKKTLKKVLSMTVNKELSVKSVLLGEYPHFVDFAGRIEKLADEYRSFKKEKGYMDYDDLLVYFRELLAGNESARERISGFYRYVMVDEYQDTNNLQGEITGLLAGPRRNVMVVGDDAQSIYGFRGASHENIMKFPEKFPGCRVIKLEVNYRSTQPVLDLANAVLEGMENKYSKCLVSARGGNGRMPGMIFFPDAYMEAEWIADSVARLRDGGTGLDSQGVLFRSSTASITLQAELMKRKIPFRVFGGIRFYEASHVKDALSILRILASHTDELAWHRSLMLIEGIGAKTADRILNDVAAAPGMEAVLGESLSRYAEGFRFSGGLKDFERFLRRICRGESSLSEKLEAIIKFYTPFMKKKFDDWPNRLKDLKEIKDIAGRYDSAEKFLADFAIDSPGKGASAPGEGEALTLSTIHSAKGLEWEAVFFMGLVEGILPIGFAAGDDSLLEEENRLFYVGVTRAKTRLCLTAHFGNTGRWDSGFGGRASRFVEAREVLPCLEILNRSKYG